MVSITSRLRPKPRKRPTQGGSRPVAYLYALAEPAVGVRYVGKTVNLKKRLRAHHNEKGTTRKVRWLASLRRRGLEPEVVILACVSAEKAVWQTAERWWIAHFRALGCDLVNLTPGGEGITEWSAESREKLRAAQQRCWSDPVWREGQLRMLRSPERCRRLSEALTGKPHSPEHVAKLPQNRPGRRLTAEHREKLSKAGTGKTWSPERRERGLAAFTPERREAQAAAMRGRKFPGQTRPQCHRDHVSATMTGRSKPPETCEKMRVAALRRWARERGEDAGELDVAAAPPRVRREPTIKRPRKTHCLRGHAVEGKNLLVLPNGSQQCRACNRLRHARWVQKQRQASGEAE